MVSTLEQLLVPNGTGPGVRRIKRPLIYYCGVNVDLHIFAYMYFLITRWLWFKMRKTSKQLICMRLHVKLRIRATQ